MDWRFIDDNTLEEYNTGYLIKLLGGTWFKPLEVKPIAPSEMAFIRQAELLRCGMDYVADLCQSQKQAGNL